MSVRGLHWLVGGYSADVLNIIKEKVFFLLFNKSFLKPSFAVWDLGRLVECVTLHLHPVLCQMERVQCVLQSVEIRQRPEMSRANR